MAFIEAHEHGKVRYVNPAHVSQFGRSDTGGTWFDLHATHGGYLDEPPEEIAEMLSLAGVAIIGKEKEG